MPLLNRVHASRQTLVPLFNRILCPLLCFQAVAADQLLALEPALNPELAKSATHARLFTLEGWCDPTEATQAFLDDAQLQGATVLFDQQVPLADTNIVCLWWHHVPGGVLRLFSRPGK